MDPKIIGNRIKLLMISKNMTASKLSKDLGISYSTLIKKMEGNREFCNTEILKLTEIFDLDINVCANIFFNPKFDIEKEIKKKSS